MQISIIDSHETLTQYIRSECANMNAQITRTLRRSFQKYILYSGALGLRLRLPKDAPAALGTNKVVHSNNFLTLSR